MYSTTKQPSKMHVVLAHLSKQACEQSCVCIIAHHDLANLDLDRKVMATSDPLKHDCC